MELSPSSRGTEPEGTRRSPPVSPSRWRHLKSPCRQDRIARVISAGTAVFLAFCLLSLLFIGYGLIDNRWYHILSVEGGSMEPTIHWGDGVVISRPPAELEKGMIVTMNVDGQVVTHRILQVDPLITQGDANALPDEWRPEQIHVVGVVRLRIPKLGWALARLSITRLAQQGGAWFRDQDTVPGMIQASESFPGVEPFLEPQSLTGTLVEAPQVTNTAPFPAPSSDPAELTATPVPANGSSDSLPATPEAPESLTDSNVEDPQATNTEPFPAPSSKPVELTATPVPANGSSDSLPATPEAEPGSALPAVEAEKPPASGEDQLTEDAGAPESPEPAAPTGPERPLDEASN